MIKTYVTLLLTVSLLALLNSQNDHTLYEQYSHILVQNQNDFWKWRAKTDRYFTNSIYIEHLSYKYYERWKNSWLIDLFPKLDFPDSVQNFGFGFGQDFYTPIDISIAKVQKNDRPYAGYLYFSIKNVSNSYTQESRLSTVYSIGVIGPLSFSAQVQERFHAFQGSGVPTGWNTQIANDVGFNIRLNYEKRIMQPNAFIDLIGYMDANTFSTISNNFATGLHYRFGLFNDYFTNTTGKKPNKALWEQLSDANCSYYCDAIKRDWQFYGYIITNLTSLLDNSFLEGGIINRSSVHTLHTDDIKRFYFQGEFGLRISAHGIDITYAQLFRTAEFVRAKNSYWGKIQLIFSY